VEGSRNAGKGLCKRASEEVLSAIKKQRIAQQWEDYGKMLLRADIA